MAINATVKSERQVGDVSVEAGRATTQMGWYRFAAREIVPGLSVLDVGCGLGSGLAELRLTAREAIGQDLDPRLKGDGMIIGPINEIPDKSYDVVVSVDVVEHVEDDTTFVRELARIARTTLFLTTPLSCYGRPLWPYHVREYRARQFIDLLAPLGELTYFLGTQSGSEIFELHHWRYFWMLDRLINSPLSNIPVRTAQKLLPHRFRFNAHHAAIVRLSSTAPAGNGRR